MGIWNLFFFCKSVLHRPGCLPLWHTIQLRWKVALRSRPSVVASAERWESLFLTCFKAFRISRYSRMLLYSFSGAVQSDVDVLFLCIKKNLGLCIHDSSVCGVLDHVGPHSSRLDVHVPNLQWSNSQVLVHKNLPFCSWMVHGEIPARGLSLDLIQMNHPHFSSVSLGCGRPWSWIFHRWMGDFWRVKQHLALSENQKRSVLMGTLMLPSFWKLEVPHFQRHLRLKAIWEHTFAAW